jgi:hypothetical protein
MRDAGRDNQYPQWKESQCGGGGSWPMHNRLLQNKDASENPQEAI